MKFGFFNVFFFSIIFISIHTNCLAEKYIEVKKLYDLYSEKILNFDQLISGLENMNLNNENIKNLISLRDDNIISEDDFVKGIKKVVSNTSLDNNEIKNNQKIIELDVDKYEFQTEITVIHSYIISDFKYGEIWNHMFILDDEKITEITFKDSKNIDFIKLTKPRFKFLKNNNFSIRSSAIYLPEPSVGIRYDFKGKIVDGKVIGEVEITYTESDEAGTVLLKAKTN